MPRQVPPKEISEKFSACLRRLRGSRTQAEFAGVLGIKNAAVYSRYENGRIPDRSVLERIAKALRVTSDDLLGDRAEVPGGFSRTAQSSSALEAMSLDDLEKAFARQAEIFSAEQRPLRVPVAQTLLHLVQEILRRYAAL